MKLKRIITLLLGLILTFSIFSPMTILANTNVTAAETAQVNLDHFFEAVSSDEGLYILGTEDDYEDPRGWLVINNRSAETGLPLDDAIFRVLQTQELTNIFDEVVILSTNVTGFTIAFPLPIGEFYIEQLLAQEGYRPMRQRVLIEIEENVLLQMLIQNQPIDVDEPEPDPEPDPIPIPPPEPEPSPTPSPPPNPEDGKVLLTLRASDTRELLRGGVFELNRAMDNTFIAELTTDEFGEASHNLAPGDYFLRQTTAPSGFTANPDRITVRISEDRITEVNVTNERIPIPEPPEPPAIINPGRLLLNVRAENTDRPLIGAVFEVRETMTDRLVSHIVTNEFGEATLDMSPNDYYLRWVSVPIGFALNTDRVNFTITTNALTTLNLTSPAINGVPEQGRLLVTVFSSETEDRQKGIEISIHDILTDTTLITLTTDSFGEASIFLPAGQYFLRQQNALRGYILSMERIPFTLTSGEITDISIATRPIPQNEQATESNTLPSAPTAPIDEEIIEPVTGRFEVFTRAQGTGTPLSGGVFAVYNANNRRIAELTTAENGLAYIDLEPGRYFLHELRPTFGFYLERQRIHFEIVTGEVVRVELTKERNGSIADMNIEGFIYIPPTGQFISLLHYLGGTALLVVALMLAGVTVFGNKKITPPFKMGLLS